MDSQQTRDYYAQNESAHWVVLTTMCIGSFMTASTTSSVNVAIPSIARDLQANALLVSWLPAAFLLTNIILLLPLGRIADRYGRKRSYLRGTIIFALASLLASFSPNIEWLLVCRVLQGLGASMLFASAMAIITSVMPAEKRGMALGLGGTSVYLGLSCGPLLGGWLTEFYGWRSVFMFQVPLACCIVASILFKVKGEWRSESQEPIDWIGSLLMAIWTSALFIGISGLPKTKSIIILIFSLLMLSVFIRHLLRAEFPLIRLRAMMGNRIFSRSIMTSVLMYASSFPLVFLLSLYLQYLQGMTPGDAGQLMVIQALVMAITAPLAGRLSDRFEPRIIASAGCLIAFLGFGILQGVDFDTSRYLIAVALSLLGIAYGLFAVPNNNAAMGSVNKERLGIASAIVSLARNMGNMLGTAMVLLLVSVYLGSNEIRVDQYPALLSVIRWALGFSCLFALMAAACSYSRGNVRAV